MCWIYTEAQVRIDAATAKCGSGGVAPDCSPQIGAELNVGGVKRLTPPTLSSAGAYDREGEEAEEKKSEVAGRMEEDSLLMDTLTAARWCGTRSFKGKLYLPQVITMNKEDSLRAVEMLRMCDGLDEEYKEDLSEPFMFMFSLQADYEEFCKEMMDKRQLQVFSGFEMR
uniref:BART domain-containing protein n=1 Tax=Knipowitschia caucasica TaxID=637954 RepID=A0AAV2KPC5_KNICA